METTSGSIDIPDWEPQKDEFLRDDLANYPVDPHTQSILDEIRTLIPKTLSHVYLAGGFAAKIAGITSSFNDVDLFCVSDSHYVRMTECLQHVELDSPLKLKHFNKLAKFAWRGVNYDLVNAKSKVDHPSLVGLLCTFDINWSMVGINLNTRKIVCHKEALSGTPKVNKARATNTVYANFVYQRLLKYGERLIRPINQEVLDKLVATLKSQLGQSAAEHPWT